MIEEELIKALYKDDRTLRQIAKEAEIADSTLGGFRNGRHHVSLYVAEQIAKALGKRLVLIDDH